MCKAKKYTDLLIEIYDNINKDINHCNSEISRLDLISQDILHIIENGNFNVVQGYKLAMKIKETRVERREIKNEYFTLDNLKKSFCDKNFQLLKETHERIKKQDYNLTKAKEIKYYKPKVLESTELDKVVPINRKVI